MTRINKSNIFARCNRGNSSKKKTKNNNYNLFVTIDVNDAKNGHFNSDVYRLSPTIATINTSININTSFSI